MTDGKTVQGPIELTTEEPQRNRVNKWQLYWFHATDPDASNRADEETLREAGFVPKAELEQLQSALTRAEGRVRELETERSAFLLLEQATRATAPGIRAPIENEALEKLAALRAQPPLASSVVADDATTGESNAQVAQADPRLSWVPKVGDKVWPSLTAPRHCYNGIDGGRVTEVRDDLGPMPYYVRWNNGSGCNYARHELTPMDPSPPVEPNRKRLSQTDPFWALDSAKEHLRALRDYSPADQNLCLAIYALKDALAFLLEKDQEATATRAARQLEAQAGAKGGG